MDSNLAYMYKMVREAKGHFDLSRKALEEYGSKVELFPGVDEWFERVRQYGDKKWSDYRALYYFIRFKGDDRGN